MITASAITAKVRHLQAYYNLEYSTDHIVSDFFKDAPVAMYNYENWAKGFASVDKGFYSPLYVTSFGLWAWKH